jgi:hypothetical protein
VRVRRIAVAPQVLEFASDDPIAARALDALYHAAPVTTLAPTLRYGVRRSGPRAADGYVATSPSRAPFGPAALGDAWAFLEWRATEDLLGGMAGDEVFLHAAGVQLGSRLVLIVGDSGAGKSTLVAHLMQRGHRMLGDDVVRFATADRLFSAVGRSVKLEPNSLPSMPLIAGKCATGVVGTLLAAGCYYVSPAAIRRSWQAEPARPWAVLLLDAGRRSGPGGVELASEGEAAVYVTQKVLGDAAANDAAGRKDVTVHLLESLADVAAYRAVGGDPAAVAEALEREAAA